MGDPDIMAPDSILFLFQVKNADNFLISLQKHAVGTH